jgi:hypothetical protein
MSMPAGLGDDQTAVPHAALSSMSKAADLARPLADDRPVPLGSQLVEGSLHELGDRLVDRVDVGARTEPLA